MTQLCHKLRQVQQIIMEKLTEPDCPYQVTTSLKVPKFKQKGLFRYEKDLFVSVVSAGIEPATQGFSVVCTTFLYAYKSDCYELI